MKRSSSRPEFKFKAHRHPRTSGNLSRRIDMTLSVLRVFLSPRFHLVKIPPYRYYALQFDHDAIIAQIKDSCYRALYSPKEKKPLTAIFIFPKFLGGFVRSAGASRERERSSNHVPQMLGCMYTIL